ncbi:MAG: type I-E CRISPR-associated protein Cse2/CasB [Chloroflexi bacterium]|nr:type I-E CRISPR-associated protein Cse2/CasB [Chloroflexota bacterium]
MSPPRVHQLAFVEHLESLVAAQDRAALAALRRGLGKDPGTVAEMHRHVVPWLPASSSSWQEDAYYLVAALFAWHQGSWHTDDASGATNLGASFARLAASVESDSVESRFVAMLNCHSDDLPTHLRHAVGLLKSKEIPIDWSQLLRDVQNWGLESRRVQRSWARAYWGNHAGEQSVQLPTAVASPNSGDQ